MRVNAVLELLDPEKLRDFFLGEGLGEMWDLDRLCEIMKANKLREVLDSGRLREVLKSQQMPDFPASSFRGALPIVAVVAPGNLPGGYRFEAEIDGHRFLATVVRRRICNDM